MDKQKLKTKIEHNRQVWEQMDDESKQIFLGDKPTFKFGDDSLGGWHEYKPKRDYFLQRFLDENKPITDNPYEKNKFEKLLAEIVAGFEYDFSDADSISNFGGGQCSQSECKDCN